MIPRFALFEGNVKPRHSGAFCATALERPNPLCKQLPDNMEVRVMCGDDRAEDAPEFPLTLAIIYPGEGAMTRVLSRPFFVDSQDVTVDTVAHYFDGYIPTKSHVYTLSEAD